MTTVITLPNDCCHLVKILKHSKYTIHVSGIMQSWAQSVDMDQLRTMMQEAYKTAFGKEPPIKFALLLQCVEPDQMQFAVIKQVPFDYKADVMTRHEPQVKQTVNITKYMVRTK